MHPYPHLYKVEAAAGPDNAVLINSAGLSTLASLPPEQFDGPGDHWSPETLLVAAVADCFILTFRAIARASQLTWLRLDCETEGILDRVDNTTRFTRFDIRAALKVPAGADEHKVTRILQKAKTVCMISNSLNAETTLEARIEIAS
jgi:peroxiredoxin-like protein